MDKKTLYEKTEKALNQAFDAAKYSVKIVSEKAGEAAHITKLLIDKATLEHRVSKKFAELGNKIYEKSQKRGEKLSLDDKEIQLLLEDTKKLDFELTTIESSLSDEKTKLKTKIKAKKSSGSKS